MEITDITLAIAIICLILYGLVKLIEKIVN